MLAHALDDLLRGRGKSPVVLTRAQCDISNESDVRRMFDHHPTLVLNCAAHTKVDLCEQEKEKADAINGYAVGNIAALCREHDASLVHVSTDFVFDGALRRPYRPTDPVNPINAYGRSKLLGETELQKRAPKNWLIVRTAWVYGRHGVNFPRTMVQAAQAGKPLKVVSDQYGSPTYAVNLGETILDLLDSGAGGIWHATNSGQTTWLDFARAALEEFGIKAEVAPLTSAQWTEMRPQSAVRPFYTVLDIEGTEKKLGRPLRPWREALKDFRAAVATAGVF